MHTIFQEFFIGIFLSKTKISLTILSTFSKQSFSTNILNRQLFNLFCKQFEKYKYRNFPKIVMYYADSYLYAHKIVHKKFKKLNSHQKINAKCSLDIKYLLYSK